MLMNKLVAGAATAAIALSIGAAAHAQSTAGQAQEVVVTGARTARSTVGLAVQVNEAKDEAIITKQFIETQVPSANFAQLINLVPGVSYSTEDPAGFNSGDLRIHGFDGNHVAVVLDGVPLNDTGNYAVFPGEYVIGEQVERVTVNIGSSDVDSPSASALGATVNITTKTPPRTFGGELKASGGSYGYGRAYGELDSGAFGPWGTTASFGGEYGTVDNFEGRPGGGKRINVNGTIYQPLSGTDFISIAGLFTKERQYPAFRVTQAQISALGRYYYGDNYTWVPETAVAGVADTVPNLVLPNGAGGTTTSSDTNFYKLFPNPVDFGIIHGQSKFTLAKGLIFTFDPSFFYTLANGGGATALKENDKRLIGNSTAKGVDLNGDGDVLDTVVAYSASETQTYRYGLTSSLLYDLNEQNHFQLSYTYDLGRHRQTGEFTSVDPLTGAPADVFGGRPGYGRQIGSADGVAIRARDRYSIALLNQISANYIGKFLDDKLHINLGVRAPYFTRKLDQHCYTFNGTSAHCDSIDPAKVQAAFNTDQAANRPQGATATALTTMLGSSNISTGLNGTPNFKFPFKQTFNFNKLLPNAGITYRLNEQHLFYASYATGFSAPKTDDLYVSSTINIQPETSDNYAIGYRYQARNLNLSVNLYDTEYKNRIVQSIDPNDPTLSIDRNVGDARVDGVDFELGWTPLEHLHFYGSANFNQSELKSNVPVQATVSGVILQLALPTKGKELVLTPDHTFSSRISYDLGPLRVGAQAKYVGSRFISDTNDLKIGSYTTVGFDARLTLPYLDKRAYVQINVQNLFNKYYVSRSTTFNSGANIPFPANPAVSFFGSTPSYNIGAPSTFYLTVGATF
jgi:iron complex outermembrane receptor protein